MAATASASVECFSNESVLREALFKIDYYYISTLSLKHSRLDILKGMSLGVRSSKFSLFSLLKDFLIDVKLRIRGRGKQPELM